MTAKVKILLVDDHAVVRAGFRMLLTSMDTIDVIAEAAKGEEACQQYIELKPDVVVMDLSMRGIGGLECIRRICVRDPAAKILVFSVHDETVFISRAFAAGAKGYITKNSAPEILITAIEKIAGGGIYLESGLRPCLEGRLAADTYQALINLLTPREFDVFCLLAKGLTTQEAADELCLGMKTVANYSTLIKAKLNVSTVAELARLAIGLKII